MGPEANNRSLSPQQSSGEGAYVQAFLTWVIAFVLLPGTILDVESMGYGLLASCWLFFITSSLLFWWRRWDETRLNLLFLRWGSLLFVLVGATVLALLVKWILDRVLREPPEVAALTHWLV
jgi:hypothetical protein